MTAPPRPVALLAEAAPVEELSTAPDSDGRRRRRQRNRAAVVDALLALYRQGNLRPSSAEIAEQAGLSARSLFRYFDDIDDLCRAAVARAHEQAAAMVELHVGVEAPLEQRVEELLSRRLRLFATMAPAATVMRLESWSQPTLAGELARARAVLRQQLRTLFSPELAAMGDAEATAALAALDVLCSFEAYQLMRGDQRLSALQVRGALSRAIALLLAPARGAPPGGRR